MIDYFTLIHKYIAPDSLTYRCYLPHVTLVTYEALNIARRLGLTEAQLQFIEEAAMLHDIGIIKVQAEKIGCTGALPYICHGIEGRQILEAEGLPQHALVAERHIGVGISQAQIVDQALPLPKREMLPESLEEKIITWADLFYGKSAKRLWQKRPIDQVRAQLADHGADKVATFDSWRAMFAEA
jgi:uncharacterized protein